MTDEKQNEQTKDQGEQDKSVEQIRRTASTYPLLQQATKAEVGVLEKLMGDVGEKAYKTDHKAEYVEAACRYGESLARIKSQIAALAANTDTQMRVLMGAATRQKQAEKGDTPAS